MPAIKHTLEEIDKFLFEASGCDEGLRVTKEAGVYGMEVDEALVELRKKGLTTEYAWLKTAMKTEAYVCYNGREITMGDAFQVFNPVTGVHTRYDSEEEARAASLIIAQQILAHQNITICKELRNENGDTAWIPVQLLKIHVS